MAEMDKIFDKENLKDFWQILVNKLESKEEGKHLSSNDFTNELKDSLLSMDGKLRDAVANIYKIKGNIDIKDLPEIVNIGDVYNIIDEFTSGESFIKSERGIDFPAGTNIVYTEDGWDVFKGCDNLEELILKIDIYPITSDFINETCQLPPISCLIVLKGKNEEENLEYNNLEIPENIHFDTYLNEPKTVYIIAEANNEFGDVLNNASDIFYYISSAPLKIDTENNINWIRYKTPFKLEQNGNWIIYAKVLDRVGKETFLSTAGFNMDLKDPIGIILIENESCTYEVSDAENIEVEIETNKTQVVSIAAYDEDTDIEAIYYYLYDYFDDGILVDKENIENLDWKLYEKEFELSKTSKYLVYAKIVDKAQNIAYIRSNFIVVDKEPPNGQIFVNDFVFNSLSTDVKTQKIDDSEISIFFDYQNKIFTKIDKVYYFISDKIIPINGLAAVKWISIPESNMKDYELESGENIIIYMKIIDTIGNIGYINTDKLLYMLTVKNFNAILNIENTEYNTYHNPNEILLSTEKLEFISCDCPEGINTYFYIDREYTDNGFKTKDELDLISTDEWTPFNNKSYSIDDLNSPTILIYIKITDQYGGIEYINSDLYLLETNTDNETIEPVDPNEGEVETTDPINPDENNNETIEEGNYGQ